MAGVGLSWQLCAPAACRAGAASKQSITCWHGVSAQVLTIGVPRTVAVLHGAAAPAGGTAAKGPSATRAAAAQARVRELEAQVGCS